MASTSSPTNCEDDSTDGPVYAPFGRNIEETAMAKWPQMLTLNTDRAVLEHMTSMMGYPPNELEVEMHKELESIIGPGDINSPASNFSVSAANPSAQIPANINELGYGYGYGCDGNTDYLPQFIDPSLTFTPGYGLETGVSAVTNGLPFPSTHAGRTDVACITESPHHEAHFPEAFPFSGNFACIPTTSPQLSPMVPSHFPMMSCGIPRPMTPDATVSDGIMTPGNPSKSTPAKSGQNHDSGAYGMVTPAKSRNSTPGKPRNPTPATPCRQTRAMTGKRSSPGTPGSVTSNGMDTSFESVASTPGATKGRKYKTPTRPRAPRRSTAIDNLPEIAAVEVMGFKFSDVQKMQARGQLPHPVIYTSLEEAKHDQFDHLLEHEYDCTIPTTVIEKQVLVGHLMNAMKDLDVADDGHKAMSPWEKGAYSDEHIEQGAWMELEDIILSQQSSETFVGSGSPKRRYKTFGDRYMSVLAYLKTSKNMAKRVVNPSGPMAIADNAVAVREGIKQNKGVNDRKAERLAMQKALTKNKSPEEIQETIASLANEGPSKRSPSHPPEDGSPPKRSKKKAGKS
ncbi:hypothetical protein N7481_005095 [Penicillium waksmanii]|uniref:uncharacterized protein n=1 Tax=Penicillium waksmanii TaxID=69791 RepID=UPI0025472959|nr:uncharacterized protein N7481_005095 [Penicillium waksmanii]KAJ5982996.1 hypothetical protein N7481_005095 [Penicillium waksmanii]